MKIMNKIRGAIAVSALRKVTSHLSYKNLSEPNYDLQRKRGRVDHEIDSFNRVQCEGFKP